MNYLDLFSGIGGFHLGFLMAGYEFSWVGYSDIDEYANKVYAMDYPLAEPFGDITKLDCKNLPTLDLVTGGFPCQDISYAGKGEGIYGKRSGLWFDMLRVLCEVRPRVALMENVPALTTRGLYAVLGSLAESGYDAEWDHIPASAVGAPHRRDRIWIVAYANGTRELQQEGGKQEQRGRLGNGGKEISDPICIICNAGGESAGREKRADFNRRCERTDVADAEKSNGRQQARYRKMSVRGGCRSRWAAEPNVGRVADGIPSRVDRLKCLGNAVVPQVVAVIAERIKPLLGVKK